MSVRAREIWRHPASGKRWASLNRRTYARLPADERAAYRFDRALRRYRYVGPEPTTAIGHGNVRGA